MTCQFFTELHEVLSSRDIVNLPEVKEAAMQQDTCNEEGNEGDPNDAFDARTFFNDSDHSASAMLKTVGNTSAKESEINSSFTEELKSEKKRERKRKLTKEQPKLDENLKVMVEVFKDSEEKQPLF